MSNNTEDIEYNRLELVDSIWHWLIEDGLRSWRFFSGMLKQNYGTDIQPVKLKNEFISFFESETGYIVFSRCPECSKGEITPRRSESGYFVSCSRFPDCRFKGK